MPALPPMILVLQEARPRPAHLVGLLEPGEPVRVTRDAWPKVPPGALLMTWPTAFRWTPPAEAFREEVRRRGGAWFTLPLVLRAAGRPPGRGLPGLIEVLAPGLSDVEDPEHLGRILLEGVARVLGEAMGEGSVPDSPSPFSTLSPVLRETIELLPTGPGVYTFQTGDGRTLYVGKAKSLRRRVRSHFQVGDGKGEILARGAGRLLWTETGGDLEATLTEHRRILHDQPSLNVQERVQRRRRGSEYRTGRLLLLLPGGSPQEHALCVVTGEGGFHWEEVSRRRTVPRGTWSRVRPFLAPGSASPVRGGGWAPGEPGRPLEAAEAEALAELTLSWLARHGERVTRMRPRPGESLRESQRRLRELLALDPREERTEVR